VPIPGNTKLSRKITLIGVWEIKPYKTLREYFKYKLGLTVKRDFSYVKRFTDIFARKATMYIGIQQTVKQTVT